MKAQAFFKLVREMRIAQQDYYRDKTKIYSKLVKAKDLERQVDEVLRRGLDEPAAALDFVEVRRPNEPEQRPLFGDEDEEAK